MHKVPLNLFHKAKNMIETNRRVLLRCALACLAASLLGISAARAADTAYPAKPVYIYVGFSAGGPTDFAARLIAQHLTDDLHKKFIVENRDGAQGNIGTEFVAAAKPDGYTGLVSGINLTINPYMTDDIKVDSRKAFEPVRIVAVAPTVLVVRPDFPAKTLQEFLAEVRKNPGKYNSAAPGSSPMLATELFNEEFHTHIVPVPYKGAAPAMVDLMSGHVDLSFATLGSVLPDILGHKVRALAIATPERDPQMPDVPTFAENGMKDFKFDAWDGLVMPAGTPRPIIEKLDHSLAKLVASKQFEEHLLKMGMKPVKDSNPEAFAQVIDHELTLYKKLAVPLRKKMMNQ